MRNVSQASAVSVVSASIVSPMAHVSADGTRDTENGIRIGCFNRSWGKWTYDEALDAIKSAGYRWTGILGDHSHEPFTSADATDEYLDKLRERIHARGLQAIVGWLRTSHQEPAAEARASARRQVDHAQRLGLKYLLTVGVDATHEYEHFYGVMSHVAAYAHDRKIQIVLKPHGGCSAAADELLRCCDRVDHENFRIWYDAGNVIHYTGKDPVAELRRVVHLVTGFCAKDCARQGGEVMIAFGAGTVDFRAILETLKDAGFRGPLLVECCDGQTVSEVTQGALRHREFLERILAG